MATMQIKSSAPKAEAYWSKIGTAKLWRRHWSPTSSSRRITSLNVTKRKTLYSTWSSKKNIGRKMITTTTWTSMVEDSGRAATVVRGCHRRHHPGGPDKYELGTLVLASSPRRKIALSSGCVELYIKVLREAVFTAHGDHLISPGTCRG